jgi:thiamine kinase-like enzyme
VVDGYRATAEAHGVKIPDEFVDAREMAERIRAVLGPQPLVPCHNDLLNANFLEGPAPPAASPPAPAAPLPHEWGGVRPAPPSAPPHEWGGIRIVDWEYAGMGDRFFDLANFSVNHEFDMEEDRRFLHAYFGEERERDLASLRLMRYMSDFREAMWGVLQSGISDLDFDFTGYAHKHFARMEGTASEARFSSFLGSPSG